MEIKNAWAAYTNTDLTEGRGRHIVIAFCELKATALRRAHKAGVQGSDGDVDKVQLIKYNNTWYGPVELEYPTDQDKKMQEEMDERDAAMEHARKAGLTEEEIRAIRYMGWRK